MTYVTHFTKSVHVMFRPGPYNVTDGKVDEMTALRRLEMERSCYTANKIKVILRSKWRRILPGRTNAEQNAQQAAEDAAADEGGPDEAQLERLEALLAGAHEGYHHPHGDRAQPHVQQRVGGRALLPEGERAVPRPRPIHVVFVRAAAVRRVVNLFTPKKLGSLASTFTSTSPKVLSDSGRTL